MRRSGFRGKFAVIANAATEVNQSILFAAAIIIAGFVPLFTLCGIEGHIFGPMAKTYGYAIAGGLIATFTISPALSALLLPQQLEETETALVRVLRRMYEPVVEFALGNRMITLGAAALVLLLAVLAVRTLGLEFLPKLEEGNFWIRATLPQFDLARGGQRLRQPDARADRVLSGGRRPSCRNMVGRMTAPTPPVSSMPNSSCRSSRSTAGPTE